MQRAVVGVDGSRGGQNALRWAGSLASAHGAEIVVMSAFEADGSKMSTDEYDERLAAHHKALEAWTAAAELAHVRIRTVVEGGDARPAIMEVARREYADLIVVGREGHSAGPGLLHMGSTAEWIAHHADRPFAIVGGTVNTDIRSAIVGADGSSGSRAALAWAAALAAHSDVRVLGAAVELRHEDWAPVDNPSNWQRDAEIRVQYAAVSTAVDTDFSILPLRGVNPADALLQAARDERTDIIVVGTRGLGGFSGLRIGGVALKVLHRADRPVVIVPPRGQT